jgi:hypothetical protein
MNDDLSFTSNKRNRHTHTLCLKNGKGLVGRSSRLFGNPFRRVVNATMENRDYDGSRRRRRPLNGLQDSEIESERYRGRPQRVPRDIDGVIVGCVSIDGGGGRGRHFVKMQVHERRSCRMIQILGVNVKEGRLDQAPEKGDSAQDCARCPHEYVC